MGSYELQKTYLLGLMDRRGQNGNGIRFSYHLKIEGSRRDVCKRTWIDTFQISEGIIKSLQDKSSQGQNSVSDGRGRHNNHPTNPPGLETLIVAHINGFPRYEHHYSIAKLGQFYLSPDLTLDGMFRDFVQHNQVIPNVERKEQLYRKCFRDSRLTIGHTHTDTCRKCDALEVELKIARRNNILRQIDLAIDQRRFHLDVVEVARNQLVQDERRSQLDPNYVMICGDMQKVLFCPTLTHSDVFYKRQLSTYNYCLYLGSTGQGTMALWDESIGHRGVDEVCSVLAEFITTNFVRLQPNQERTLIFWCDRCRGQTNNYQILCFFKFLIEEGYFTSAEQKLAPTGHSYMPPDRLFGLIEQKKKTASVMVPEEWVQIIRSTCIERPFEIQQMTQRNIFDFKALEAFIPRPSTLRVTENCWFRVTAASPALVHTRDNFAPGFWSDHIIRRPLGTGMITYRPQWTRQDLNQFVLQMKYTNPLPISREKYQDLITMIPLMMPEYRGFYINLPHS